MTKEPKNKPTQPTDVTPATDYPEDGDVRSQVNR